MVGLFAKKKKSRRPDPAEMELFSRSHRSMIQLKDSEEESEDRGSSNNNHKASTSSSLSKPSMINTTAKQPIKVSTATRGKRAPMAATKTQKSFRRLGLSQSDDSSVSFDVRNQPHQTKPPEDVLVAIETNGAAQEILVKDTAGVVVKKKKLKLKFGGAGSTKKFHKLDNVEGSHASFTYEPPSDYASLVGTGVNTDRAVPAERSRHLLANAALSLRQIASQSFSDYGGGDVPPPTSPPSNPEDAYVPPPGGLLFATGLHEHERSPHDNHPFERSPGAASDGGEFRQFVFDKNFQTIEAVHVEKSDSGTGDADIFRMAAVETVARMALQQQQQQLQEQEHQQKRYNVFSPTSVGSRPFLPGSGGFLPPKSSLEHHHVSRGTSGPIKPIRKPPSPSSYSRASTKDASSAHPSDASFEDFSKQRFQELVQRNGKLRSPAARPAPLSTSSGWDSNSKTHNSTKPSSETKRPSKAEVKSKAVQDDTEWSSVSNVSSKAPKQLTANPMKSASRSIPSDDPRNPMSPLRTIRHFGNQSMAASSQSGVTSSSVPQRLLPPPRVGHKAAPKVASNAADLSVFSSASITGATVSTGPDENAPEVYRQFDTHPYDLDDDDDPFKIGPGDKVDDEAWNVDRAPKFQTRRGRATPAAVKVSHDNSSLIDSIQKATSKTQGLRRHQRDAVHRPDPSPRGVPPSSSDSVLDFTPVQDGGRSTKHKRSECDEAIVMSLSDGAMERETLGNVRQLAAATAHAGRNSSSARSKAPSGVPENAILASMLFRQTEVFASSPSYPKEGAGPGSATKAKPVVRTVDQPPKARLNVPPTIHASSNDSVVSSVTEEASSFYHKNLQQHPFKAQAHNALNNYHILRSKQSSQQQHHHHHHSQSSSNSATPAGQPPPQRRWVSSSSSRKTASSTGRPTWLDRVEAEHMRMFNE